MRRTFFIRLALLNTFKKRIRALLVISGIAITSSAMIVLFGVSGGLHKLVDDQIANGNAKDVVTVDPRNLQQIRLDQAHLSQVQSISGVTAVESSVGLLGDFSYKGNDLSIPIYGVSKDYFSLSPLDFVAGTGNEVSANNIVVSTKVLEALGLSQAEALGHDIASSVTISKDYSSQQTEESVTTPQANYKIVGVVDKGVLPVAYFPLESLRTQGVDTVSQLKLRASSADKVPEVREAVEQMGFKSSSIQDTVEQINKIFTVIQKTLVIFGLIVFGITVSGTFTVISLTLMEEMRQVGFLRISGMRNWDVKVLFIVQSILLTTLGAFFGVLGGLVGGAAVNELAARAATGNTFSGTVSVFAVPAPQIVLVMVLAVGIGWAVALLPAKRAVMISPLEEMKL